MFLATLSACALGLAAGVRHAIEPDHVAAVSTLLADGKPPSASMRWATAWGAGHGVMLVALAAPLAIAGASLPRRASNAFELVVAFMLVALGVRSLALAARPATAHVPHAPARLPFAVGLVHGLAGSGALAALASAQLGSAGAAIAFVTIYALGALAGMAALAGVLGAPLGRLGRAPRGRRAVSAIAAVLSIGLGIAWAAAHLVSDA